MPDKLDAGTARVSSYFVFAAVYFIFVAAVGFAIVTDYSDSTTAGCVTAAD